MASIGDPIYEYFSDGFRGQPRVLHGDCWNKLQRSLSNSLGIIIGATLGMHSSTPY